MKKIAWVITICIFIAALVSCAPLSAQSSQATDLPSGTALHILVKNGDTSKSFKFAEFEYITDDIIKVTDIQSDVYYIDAANLVYIEVTPDKLLKREANLASDFEYEIKESENKQKYIVITGYKGTSVDVVIPESIEGIPVREIGNDAFADSLVENVIVPNTVKAVGNEAFRGCINLKTVEFGDGIENLGYGMFTYADDIIAVKFTGSRPQINVVISDLFTRYTFEGYRVGRDLFIKSGVFEWSTTWEDYFEQVIVY